MRSVLTTAAVLIVIVTPALAQSFDPDAGTGNIVPPVANQGGAGAYAQAPDTYEKGICPRTFISQDASFRV